MESYRVTVCGFLALFLEITPQLEWYRITLNVTEGPHNFPHSRLSQIRHRP